MATTKKKTQAITVGGVKVARVDPATMENTGDYGWSIVVADRGFVWVGDTIRHGDSVYMANAFNIRQWGTKRGLGQLALEGPQPESEIDPVGVVVVPMRAVIAFMPTPRQLWNKLK